MAFLWNAFGVKKDSRGSKARKFKKLINKLIGSLKNEEIKRNSIIRQSEAEIALLLKAGHYEKVTPMVEPLYKKMCIVCAYHELYYFGVRVRNHLNLISNRELPHEVNVAVSSLIFASSICGQEFHELQLIQDLFRDIYGCDFIKTNVELLPGNFVDVEMKENLCVDSVPDKVKLRFMNAISEKYLEETILKDVDMKENEYLEMPKKSCSLCSSSDCDSQMSFASESEEEFSHDFTSDSEDGYTEDIEEIEMEYHRLLNLNYTRWFMSGLEDGYDLLFGCHENEREKASSSLTQQ